MAMGSGWRVRTSHSGGEWSGTSIQDTSCCYHPLIGAPYLRPGPCRAGAGHAGCLESLQRTAWEEFFARSLILEETTAGEAASNHGPSLLWPYCRRSHDAEPDWRACASCPQSHNARVHLTVITELSVLW